jgi:methionine synthase II (cobalamin-independent)
VQLDLPMETAAVQTFQLDPGVVVAQIEEAFRGVRNVQRIAHFCSRMIPDGDEERDMRAILPAIERLGGKVERVFIECTRDATRELLAAVPRDVEVIAGIAEVAGEVPPVDVLVRRGREALRSTVPERLWLAPACALRGCGSERAVQILANVVAAARRLPH